MWFRTLLMGAAIATLNFTPVFAEIVIRQDPGGRIGSYLEAAARIRAHGQRVVVDGPCLSACTLIIAAVPRENVCVTPRAMLGFHAAWSHGMDGRRVPNWMGTQALMANYPENVRRWIARKGGLSPKMIFLRGRELASFYRRCA